MAETTAIQWTSHTFNPWRGCTKVSPGCAHCYAETLSNRNPKVLGVWGPNGTRVLAAEAQWAEPVKWNRQAAADQARAEVEALAPRSEYDGPVDYRRPMVFCASLADVFEDWPGGMVNPNGSRAGIVRTEEITGRSAGVQRVEPYTLAHARARLWDLIRATPALDWQLLTKRPENIPRMMPAGSWPNVWLGASVETPAYLWRLDALIEAAGPDAPIEVPVRFCSAEPLVAPLALTGVLGPPWINWVIVGGESGGGARPLDPEWVRALVDQCRRAGVACFVKQMGTNPVGLELFHAKGGDEWEWPRDLQIREFPGEYDRCR